MTTNIARGKVITVERRRSRIFGRGILKGLGVVGKHWVKSFSKLDDYSKIAGTFTTEYPEERLPLPETYRNMPILLYDDETGHELCTSCFQCQRICPPQVIHMTQAQDPATGKPVPAVAEFILEYDACMSCGFCAEVCPFDAIKMDHAFELSTADHPTLTVHKQDLNRPVSYYASIAPTLWAESQAQAYKKLQQNMKRRPGAIGIAPHLVARIKAATAPAAPAPDGEATPGDKAAKLAAIRAANAAKQAGGATPGAEAAATAAPEAAPQDDKAAKLAAIRAANAAKQAGGATPGAEAAATAAPEAAPQDDKAAKLAAIRAANAAKKAGTTPPAAEAAATAAPEAAPQNDKAAKLAAIRAANAAKKAQEAAATASASNDSAPAQSAASEVDTSAEKKG